MIKPSRWKEADGLTLEPNARTAVATTTGNLAVTAGPGAGKTELLAQRADFLLRTGACRYPSRILAISFKVDASQNLRARARQRCGPDLAARFDSYTFHAFSKRIIDRFRVALIGSDALDRDYSIGPRRVQGQSITFKDLIPLATTILETNQIALNAVRQTYSHVFLDEFQDCTTDQYQLISTCFLGTDAQLTAVGDTKQRIMGWAGALEGIFEQYAADFAATPLNLYQNFRSKPRLRRAQNAMVRFMDPAAAVDEKTIFGCEGAIDDIAAADTFEEADRVANTIADLHDNQTVPLSEIAVLVSREQTYFCQELRVALDTRRVPYREEDRAQDLASEPAARLITDFLTVAGTTGNPDAYRRLTDTVIYSQALDEEHEYRARSRWDRFVGKTGATLSNAALFKGTRAELQTIVDQMIGVVGRDAVVALSPDYGQGDRLETVMATTIDQLAKLLAQHAALSTALNAFSADEAVRIMSIHKSKGLEFDTVIVLGVEKETFWGDATAERSAYFVAISRARQRLILTTCAERRRPDDWPRPRWDMVRHPHEEFLGYVLPYR